MASLFSAVPLMVVHSSLLHRDLYGVLMSSVQGLSRLNLQSQPEQIEQGCALVTLLETVTHAAAAASSDR